MTREELRRKLALIVITDPNCGPGRELADVVAQALAGGAPAIQLRAKEASAREMAELGRRLLELTRAAGALLFVNDRVDVALAIGADGAHVGSDDLPVPAARQIAPPGFLIGRSVDRAEEVPAAIAEGADYIGAGPVYPTGSKPDAGPVMGIDGLRQVCAAAGDSPVVGIGGINGENAEAVVAAGAVGVSVISAVMQAEDPAAATGSLLAAVQRGAAPRAS